MEWVILIAIAATYASLSEKLAKLTNIKNTEQKKRFPSLKSLIDKNIEIELMDDFEGKGTKGILKKYDDTWIVLESKNKKEKIELNYFRLSNILSINIIED